MLISVAMATYNGARYIREQIDSILRQTIQDFELVICDDCSSDETWKILNAIRQTDSRISIYRNDSNLGFKKNFEKVISLCNGDLIALSDQDDVWLPKHLEVLKDAMKSDTQIACARPLFVDEYCRELPAKYDYFKMYAPPKTDIDIARHILLGFSSYQGASMLIRKHFFEKALPIPEKARYHDSWFALLACFTGGLIYVDEPVMWYRRLETSVTVRTMRVCAFRRFVGITINRHTEYDSSYLIEVVKRRIERMPPQQYHLLQVSEKIKKRRKSLWGRMVNVPYFLRYFQTIYACNIWHIFS